MQLPQPIEDGIFIKRYKRFFAEFELNGKTEVAHVPNTGSLKGLLTKGSPCRVSFSNDPKRKLKYTLQQLKAETSWVGVNTQNANSLVKEAWEKKHIEHWKSFDSIKPEIKISKESRLDFALFKEGQLCRYIEVKNVTMSEGSMAMFPDAETTRGQKHLSELIRLKSEGFEVEMLFVVQRADCLSFRAAHEVDAKYAKLLKEASDAGVEISVYAVNIAADRIELGKKLIISWPQEFYQ
jgi:sugar fermentation stimulation protein A